MFSNAFELEKLTPTWLRFSVITPPPIAIGRGTLIDYRLRVHGLPLRWQSLIAIGGRRNNSSTSKPAARFGDGATSTRLRQSKAALYAATLSTILCGPTGWLTPFLCVAIC